MCVLLAVEVLVLISLVIVSLVFAPALGIPLLIAASSGFLFGWFRHSRSHADGSGHDDSR